MKLGILCHACLGGSSRVALRSAVALAERGHEVHVFSPGSPLGSRADLPIIMHRFGEDPVDGPLRWRWPADQLDRFAERVRAIVIERALDVVHFHYAAPFAEVCARLVEGLGARSPRIVGTLHGTDVFHLAQRSRLARHLEVADVLTTVSHAQADVATEGLRLTRRPVTIPNFVDLDRYRPLPTPRPRPGALAPILLHASNFRRVKAPLDVVEIFRLLSKRRRVRLWMVGTGELWGETRAKVRTLGLDGAVCFFGLRTDLHRLLPNADLLLMASHYESFCLSALEAMACGVPVLAPAVGGLPELVAPPEGGVLFPPGDLGAAARAAEALLDDSSARSSRARSRAHLFNVARAIDAYEEVYAGVLHARDAE